MFMPASRNWDNFSTVFVLGPIVAMIDVLRKNLSSGAMALKLVESVESHSSCDEVPLVMTMVGGVLLRLSGEGKRSGVGRCMG